jgi:myo-inositol-1(or 4)-monophosphatase
MSHDPLLLASAIEVVLRAGEMQMASFGQQLQIDKKGTIDLVTHVDLAVETMFREFVRERFPTHRVLAEEFQDEPGGDGSESECCWIFDPIDGTTNYAHGLPIFCASLALEIAGELVVAAEIVGLFGAYDRQARAVRRLGSAALDLCYVGAGRLDGFWEQRLRPWDAAAGALVVLEAGGVVQGWAGEPFAARHGQVVASNGRIQRAMLDVIRAYYDERSGNRTP